MYEKSSSTKILPAFRGRMGNNIFYTVSLKAPELLHITLPEFQEPASPFRREFNFLLNQNELVAYMANNPHWFFGSIIVQIDNVIFEPLAVDPQNRLLSSSSSTIGLVKIPMPPVVRVLDGVQRLKAMRKLSNTEVFGDASLQVSNADITVIILDQPQLEVVQTISNKVQRQSKSSTRGDAILMNDEDSIGVLSRRLIEPGAILDSSGSIPPLVNWKNTTLSARSARLTTLSAVYEICELIVNSRGYGNRKRGRTIVLREAELKEVYQIVEDYWKTVLEGIDSYKIAVKDHLKIPELRSSKGAQCLLFKPPFQIGLFKGLLEAEKRYSTTGKTFSQLVAHANGLPWTPRDQRWHDVVDVEDSQFFVRSTQEAINRTTTIILESLQQADKNRAF